MRDRIGDIAGVAQVETRVVVDVTLDVEGLSEPATGRLISIPARRRSMLNDIVIRRGRYIDGTRPDEVIVNEGFALAHNLTPGDTVTAVINGRRRDLEVVGFGLSPEFIYTIRPGELIPDNTRFGVFWMERRALASAFDMEGGFNDVTLSLMPGAREEEVIQQLDTLIESYGGFGAIPRALQLSHWSLSQELNGLQGVGQVVPLIFLSIAAFLLNVVLTRMVSVQREQIAALKALGYTNAAIGWHYTKWALAIALTGAVIGTAAGAAMGNAMMSIYNELFQFPALTYRLLPSVVTSGVLISLLADVLGAATAVRRAVRLPPAEAMRPQPPARYRVSLVERLGIQGLLSQPARIVLRNIQRQPVRSLASVTGIAFSVAMLIAGTFSLDAMDEMMDVQFSVAQHQDVTVTFVEAASAAARHELQRMPGVLTVESTRSIPARLRFGSRSRQLAISGLPEVPRLSRVLEVTDLSPVTLPPDGLVVSRKLAEILAIDRGDVVRVEVLLGARPVREVVVADVVKEYMGLSAYMEINSLRRLLRESETLSGGFITVDPSRLDALYRVLKATPVVAGVTLKGAALESFEETFAENINVMIFFNVLFAGIIACGVVYNAARMSLSERSRELASLRVIGFTRAEISSILLGELAVLTCVAIPAGLLVGYGLAALVVTLFDTELYSFPLAVAPRTYALSTLAVLTATVLSGLLVRRKLDSLDLVEVLKTRE
ncbi:MAG: ABC transporter permease [Vicinamibacterales bacterium]|nr:ABC transporter permease [Vicinamibacterales bacterium]MDP7691938.1 ABC transporter permease [Vicinamibacterales bacterium]HJN46969.1 ABC transporter permease [Vicinamibacterales bacterium]